MNRSVLTMVVAAVVALGVGVAAGAAMWAGGDHWDGTTPHGTVADMGMQDGATMMPEGAMDERHFLERMVPHHESAIVMAELAVTKGQRPEVTRLATEIIAAQRREIASMKAWHRDWYGETLVPSTDGMHHSVDTAALESARGAEFDRAFLRMMIPHHASAIVMAEAVMMGSPRKEVATLADEITAAQSKEIGQMQQWRQAWFPPLG